MHKSGKNRLVLRNEIQRHFVN